MLIHADSNAEIASSATIADAGKIRPGAGYRLPDRTADAGKIRLGAGYRLPLKTA